jgi:hypothetical protein
MRVEHRVHAPVNLDRAGLKIDSVEKVPVLQFPFGTATNDLSFEFELNDRRGLLHPRHQEVVAQARALRLEALRRVVAVNRSRESFERRGDDAVALFELRKPTVAERDSEDSCDERRIAEARAHPLCVVIAPGERDVRLLQQVLDDAVNARAAVAEVSGDDDLGD